MASFRDPNKIQNKLKRQSYQLKQKKLKESEKRDERLKRRRTEDKNPKLREDRQTRNVPQTIDKKRTWDEVAGDGDDLGLAVDLVSVKRRKSQGEEDGGAAAAGKAEVDKEEEDDDEDSDEEPAKAAAEDVEDDVDSMLGSDSEDDDDDARGRKHRSSKQDPPDRAPSEAPSTATDLNVTPEAIQARFPSLFEPAEHDPKVLITTSINATIHHEAELLTRLFPNSVYIKRTAHFHAHKHSVREIAQYASNRKFTTVVIMMEEAKKPKGLDIVHLPHGPMFHFSISNWVEGAKLPGHGNPTNHYPELILNGFRTPLGLLTAHLFKSVFPQRPEIQGRQVVTLHNQRDYIFFRRHRYVFRDKRATEKVIQGTDGKPMEGVQEIRAGLQELGPRFTLKLRRIDKGIQRASGQEWEWAAGSEKVRTRFQL